MDSQQPDDVSALSARQRIRHSIQHFPGLVAIANPQPEDTALRWRAEDMDDRSWALEAVYTRNGKPVLVVRTVRGSLDWEPAFETDETLRSTMAGANTVDPTSDVPETATSLDIDGTRLAGSRIDLADRSGVYVEWQGQRVFCVGDSLVIDNLLLRTATSLDFAE